jgi:hypothetical protein
MTDFAAPMRPVADNELLARFVLFSGWIRKDLTIRSDAFIPPPNRELSVTRHQGFDEQTLWSIGQGVADKRPATLYGRADISALSVRKNKLDVAPAEPPKNHANITGWLTDKPSQKIIAQELAASAQYVAKPN